MDQEQTEVIEELKPEAPAAPQADAPVDAAPEGDKPTEEVEAKEADDPEKAKSKFQRRLDRQKAARVAAETEARLLREENARLKAEREQAAARVQGDAPQRDQYEDDAAYHRALGRWEATQEARQRERETEQQRQQRERMTAEEQQRARIAESWEKREAEFRKVNPDYEKQVQPFLEHDLQHFGKGAREAIVESDLGPQVLHYLATHAEDAERIADLSPARQIAEIGKIEANLTRPRRMTNAPDPISPVKSGASGVKDPSKMTAQEFSAWRASQGSNWITSPLRGA